MPRCTCGRRGAPRHGRPARAVDWRILRPPRLATGGTLPGCRGAPGHGVAIDALMAVACGDETAPHYDGGRGEAPSGSLAGERLIALDAATGAVLTEIALGPVVAGPSLSRGREYVGGGKTLWTPGEFECFVPKQYSGSVRAWPDRRGRGRQARQR